MAVSASGSVPPATATLSPTGKLLWEAVPQSSSLDWVGRKGQGCADLMWHRASVKLTGQVSLGQLSWRAPDSCAGPGALRTDGSRSSHCPSHLLLPESVSLPFSLFLSLLCSYTFAQNVPEQLSLPGSCHEEGSCDFSSPLSHKMPLWGVSGHSNHVLLWPVILGAVSHCACSLLVSHLLRPHPMLELPLKRP